MQTISHAAQQTIKFVVGEEERSVEAPSSMDVNEAIHTLNVGREQSLFSDSEHNCSCE